MRIEADSKFGRENYCFLDGELIRNAIEADDVEGWVDIASYHCGQRHIERLHGEVTFFPVHKYDEYFVDPYDMKGR